MQAEAKCGAAATATAAPDDDGGRPLSIGLVSAGWPPDAHPNGVTTYVAGLAEGLRELGHRVTILDATLPAGDHGDGVVGVGRPAGRPLSRRAADWLWYRAAPRPWIERGADRALAARIGRAAAAHGVEVLEMEEAFGRAGGLQRSVPIPLSLRLHGPWFLNGEALGQAADSAFRARVAREGRVIARATALSAPSLDVLERTRAYYGLPLEHGEVIPNPTRPVPAPDRWRAVACEPGTILFVGRFDRHKGGDTIIEAFARVLREAPGALLRFAGPDRGLVDDRGRRWGLAAFVDDRLPGARESGRVHLLGHVPHSRLDDLRRRSAVTVACSRYEVFGLTATEAMAIGAPVVAARVGGLAEIVRDGVDGLLHRPGDPDDLAARILELLSDPARAAELGGRAAVRCEREFRPDVVAARTAAHLRRAAGARAGPATGA